MLPYYLLIGASLVGAPLPLQRPRYHWGYLLTMGLAALAAGAAYFLMDPLINIAVTIAPKYQHYLTEKYWQGNRFLYVLMPLGCFLLATSHGFHGVYPY